MHGIGGKPTDWNTFIARINELYTGTAVGAGRLGAVARGGGLVWPLRRRGGRGVARAAGGRLVRQVGGRVEVRGLGLRVVRRGLRVRGLDGVRRLRDGRGG